jgi:hypothetical protein
VYPLNLIISGALKSSKPVGVKITEDNNYVLVKLSEREIDWFVFIY